MPCSGFERGLCPRKLLFPGEGSEGGRAPLRVKTCWPGVTPAAIRDDGSGANLSPPCGAGRTVEASPVAPSGDAAGSGQFLRLIRSSEATRLRQRQSAGSSRRARPWQGERALRSFGRGSGMAKTIPTFPPEAPTAEPRQFPRPHQVGARSSAAASLPASRDGDHLCASDRSCTILAGPSVLKPGRSCRGGKLRIPTLDSEGAHPPSEPPPEIAPAKPALEQGMSVVANPHARPRTLRLAPPSGLGLLASPHGTSGCQNQSPTKTCRRWAN